jgi:hypothetical protein
MSDQLKALDVLKTLQSYGYKEREVKFGDVKLVLAPLTAIEVVDIFEISNKYDDTDASTNMLKIHTVARSIISINDVKLNPKGMLDDKLNIVSSFGAEVVDYLFNEYCILDKVIKASVDKREYGEKKE